MMGRLVKAVAFCGAVLGLAASAALAAEPDEGRRPPGPDAWRRPQPGLFFLLRSEAARAELKRHHRETARIMTGFERLRRKIQEEIKNGAEPREAIRNNLAAGKVLTKELLDEQAKHFRAMARLADAVGDDAIEKITIHLLRGRRRPGRREGDRPQRPAPPEGRGAAPVEGQNPFND